MPNVEADTAYTEANCSAQKAGSRRHRGRQERPSMATGIHCDEEIDLESGKLEMKLLDSNKKERDCRICHLSLLKSGGISGGVQVQETSVGMAIELGCSCKDYAWNSSAYQYIALVGAGDEERAGVGGRPRFGRGWGSGGRDGRLRVGSWNIGTLQEDTYVHLLKFFPATVPTSVSGQLRLILSILPNICYFPSVYDWAIMLLPLAVAINWIGFNFSSMFHVANKTSHRQEVSQKRPTTTSTFKPHKPAYKNYKQFSLDRPSQLVTQLATGRSCQLFFYKDVLTPKDFIDFVT
ncbi:hypothetical protein FXO37_09680 [Capsicum annuum]|nr:hypothetical protein FXO37_09680 [Capsicum annuum]